MTPPEMPFSRYRNIAISRFRLENGKFPASLIALTLALLATILSSAVPVSGADSDKSTGTGAAGQSTVARPITDKWALVIGIGKFADPSIPTLKYSTKDAVDFADFLMNKCNFAPDHVLLMLDEEATDANIRRALGDEWLPRRVLKDDLVVVYFSTHGSPEEIDIARDNFVVAYNTRVDNLFSTGLKLRDLAPTIKERTGCDRVVLILDACHSGAAQTSAKGIFRGTNFDVSSLAGEGQVVLSSSDVSQKSWESSRYPNGVFTHWLIESIDREGSLKDAYGMLRDKVAEEVKFDRGSEQSPVMKSRWKGPELSLKALPSRPRAVPEEQVFKRVDELIARGHGPQARWIVGSMARAGNVKAKSRYGSMLLYGQFGSKDLELARQMLSAAANDGDSSAQHLLGLMYEGGKGVEKSESEAVKWYRLSASQNNPRGLYCLGSMYFNGAGVPQDRRQAISYFQKSAELGFAPAQNTIGRIYLNGDGVPKDYSEAAHWLEQAAQDGNVAGMYALGDMYENGWGVKSDYARALKLFRESAARGHAASMNRIGLYYYFGRGVARDSRTAATWFARAAEAGSSQGQNNLGNLYLDGNGVPRDRAKAIELFRKAAAQGLDASIKRLRELGYRY